MGAKVQITPGVAAAGIVLLALCVACWYRRTPKQELAKDALRVGIQIGLIALAVIAPQWALLFEIGWLKEHPGFIRWMATQGVPPKITHGFLLLGWFCGYVVTLCAASWICNRYFKRKKQPQRKEKGDTVPPA